jgi:PAS domain S-box-containing protein
MVFVKDAKDLRFVKFNKAGENLLGYSRQELLGKNDYDFFPEDQADFFTSKDTEVIDSSQLLDTPEEKIQTKNQGERILHTKKIPLRNHEGIPQYLLGISEDITERKRSEKELHQKSEELSAAYEEMAATAEELRQNYDELHRSQQALEHARKKLNLLNTVTFQDIQNAVFALSGYIQLQKDDLSDEERHRFRTKEIGIVKTLEESLQFAAQYQNLGLQSPKWQNVHQAFLVGISHVDLTRVSRKHEVSSLEVYADSLFEQVFFSLAENVVLHGKTATEIALSCRQTNDALIIIFEDNGIGIQTDMKEKIFSRKSEDKKGLGLFLVREILGITGITIRETGDPGKGARFEMTVPEGAWRDVGK